MTTEDDAHESSAPIRVLVVDDHTIVRKGILALLGEVKGIEVVGEAANGKAAVAQVLALDPDVTLMDLAMPIMDGIEAIGLILTRQPDARILVLTFFATDDKVFPAIRAGALGYLLKDSKPTDLVEAIERVSRGEPFLHPAIAMQVLSEMRRPPKMIQSPHALTECEADVLRRIAAGMCYSQIAGQLSIAEDSIKGHVSNILGKLQLANVA